MTASSCTAMYVPPPSSSTSRATGNLQVEEEGSYVQQNMSVPNDRTMLRRGIFVCFVRRRSMGNRLSVCFFHLDVVPTLARDGFVGFEVLYDGAADAVADVTRLNVDLIPPQYMSPQITTKDWDTLTRSQRGTIWSLALRRRR